MRNKPDENPPTDRAAPAADTRSLEQSMGGRKPAPDRRNERLPHERDESAQATGDRLKENPVPSDRKIRQANEDVEGGLVDTDRRGVPNDVPKR